MNNNIATNLQLVESRIKSTSSSRENMISALNNLEQTINSTNQWQGVDADAHKSALLDFTKKLKSSAAWMEAAGNAAISQSTKLHDRAEQNRNARIFE